jgi:Tol biopolymer transport system component
MNADERIEEYLSAAPRPAAPDSLMNRLRNDIAFRGTPARPSALRRWFAPSSEGISYWRVAAAAVIALIVLLPLSYGATQLIKRLGTISQLPGVSKAKFPWGYGGAALSPDGKYLAGTTMGFELVVIDTSTGELRKLAENCFWCTPVVWSADGSEIAYLSRRGDLRTGMGLHPSSLLALSMKTGKTRILMEDPLWPEDWSSDGKLILGEKMSQKGLGAAVLVNLGNKEETVLAEEGASPRFASNARSLSYVTKEANRSILHLRSVDGTSHVRYADFPGTIDKPLWSPDGTHVVFAGTQMGLDRRHKDLWALRVEGDRFLGLPLPVIPNVQQMQFYNWSQNGQLAYVTGFQLDGIYTLPVDARTGKAGGPPRQLMLGGNQCCWSPDGKQIAFWQKQEGGEGAFIFVSADSGERIRTLSVAELTGTSPGMSWSPDGRLIACGGTAKQKRRGVFLITVETGDIRLLAPLERAPNSLTWSPDGKAIAYGQNNGVYVVNVEDGKPRQIASPAEKEEIFNRPFFAPDGGSVAYAHLKGPNCDTVLATTIDGKETREICRVKDAKLNMRVFSLSPDGRRIVFTPGDEKIWCAPTDGGEPFLMADISDLGETVFAWGAEWSPKGDAISFGVGRQEYQYWVMENFLPLAKAGKR